LKIARHVLKIKIGLTTGFLVLQKALVPASYKDQENFDGKAIMEHCKNVFEENDGVNFWRQKDKLGACHSS